MLISTRLKNLKVVVDNHTNLEASTQMIEAAKKELAPHLRSLECRLSRHLIPQRCAVFVRINADASLYIDVDPARSKNPFFFRYDNRTGEVSSQMPYKEFERLMTDSGTLCYLVSRLDRIERMHMQQFGRGDTIQKIDRLTEQDAYER